MDSLSPNPHTHNDKRKRWQTVVSSLITQWWHNSQISLLITTERMLTSMNSTWSRLRNSSNSGLSYERGFRVPPLTRVTAQFSLTMSISRHSAYKEKLASEVQSSLGGLPCKFQPQPLSLLEVRLANVQKGCVCVCVHAHTHSVSPVWLSVTPMNCSPPRLLCPWDFPGKNTGLGCYFLLHIYSISILEEGKFHVLQVFCLFSSGFEIKLVFGSICFLIIGRYTFVFLDNCM